MRHQPTNGDVRREAGQARNLYIVNPNDPDNAYASLALAAAAAIAAVPAGQTIHFLLHDGTYADAVDFGTQHPVVVEAVRYRQAVITGALTFGAKGTLLRSVFKGLSVQSGGITILDGNNLEIFDSYLASLLITLNPSAGVVGYNAQLRNCLTSSLRFSETASAAGSRTIVIEGGQHSFNSTLSDVISVYKAATTLRNLSCRATLSTNAFFNANADTATIDYENINMFITAFNSEPLMENAPGSMDFQQATFIIQTDSLNMGGVTPDRGYPQLIADAAPTNPIIGTMWEDTRTKEILTWNGTYWVVGDLVRVETLVGVGGAAQDHDLGWNVPSGYAVVKASVRLLKALTGAGGAVKAGFGTKVAGDPDKYALTAALTVGNPNQTLNPTYNNGSGDDLAITACDAAGAALGTLAGSGASDVRTMVWMRPPVTLAS